MAKQKEKAAPARLLKADLERYFQMEQQRLQLQRQANDLAKLQEELEEQFIAYVRANGDVERVCVTSGYRLMLQQKDGSVSWKKEFLRVAGVDAAEALIQAAPKKEVLVIEPPAKEAVA